MIECLQVVRRRLRFEQFLRDAGMALAQREQARATDAKLSSNGERRAT